MLCYNSYVASLAPSFFAFFFFFFFNDTATTEIYTLSLHDALPISLCVRCPFASSRFNTVRIVDSLSGDRKSTRLNSSHLGISYAVFCLKKKKKYKQQTNYKTLFRHY